MELNLHITKPHIWHVSVKGMKKCNTYFNHQYAILKDCCDHKLIEQVILISLAINAMFYWSKMTSLKNVPNRRKMCFTLEYINV